jgi:hypothetical protein
MYEYPKTLLALKEVEREQTQQHAASDAANWRVGDCLLEEAVLIRYGTGTGTTHFCLSNSSAACGLGRPRSG